MARLISFTFISLNGYYKGKNEDITWHRHGGEEAEYSIESLKTGNTLLFGRKTYQMMAEFWQSPHAHAQLPEVAKGMNASEKIVASRTLTSADWPGTQIIQQNLIHTVRRLKKANKKNITILGSGNLVRQLAQVHLIDEFQIMVDPVILNEGVSLFENINHKIDLKLNDVRTFKSGVVLLSYTLLK
jgi:dihydrofolate reductase